MESNIISSLVICEVMCDAVSRRTEIIFGINGSGRHFCGRMRLVFTSCTDPSSLLSFFLPTTIERQAMTLVGLKGELGDFRRFDLAKAFMQMKLSGQIEKIQAGKLSVLVLACSVSEWTAFKAVIDDIIKKS